MKRFVRRRVALAFAYALVTVSRSARRVRRRVRAGRAAACADRRSGRRGSRHAGAGRRRRSPTGGQAGQAGAAFGWGNPQAANGTIGGGNATESSSHPITGDQEDSFDFSKGGAAGGAVHGDSDGPVFLGGGMRFSGGETP